MIPQSVLFRADRVISEKGRVLECRVEREQRTNMKRINHRPYSLRYALCALLSPPTPQQTGKIFRIGFLDNSTASGIAVLLEAFRQELRKLGWIEGKNIAIEYRFSELKPERLPELAADLVRLNVDLIVTTGGPPALAVKRATTSVMSLN